MGGYEPSGHKAPKTLSERLDQGFADLNAFLIVLAIGLLVLDISCFTALRMGEMLAEPSVSAPSSPPSPPALR